MYSFPLLELVSHSAEEAEDKIPLTFNSSISGAVFRVVRVQDLLYLLAIWSFFLSRIDFQITNHKASIKLNVKINDPS